MLDDMRCRDLLVKLADSSSPMPFRSDGVVIPLTVWQEVLREVEQNGNAPVHRASHCSSTATLVSAMLILSNVIQSDDGVANCAIREAADRLEQLDEAVKVLHDLLHRSTAVFVPSTDNACSLNHDALVKYEWMTKD